MSDSRMRIWFSLFVLVVFCVGLAGGVLIGRRMLPPPPFDRGFRGPGLREFGPGPVGEAGRGGPPPGRLLERLTTDLALTADQQSKIQTILTASRTRVEGLQRETFERFETERRGIRDEIRKILTPEQQEKFDKTEMENRGRFGRRGPPPR
jgi:Spy/CpxP family protein refolding chaperone